MRGSVLDDIVRVLRPHRVRTQVPCFPRIDVAVEYAAISIEVEVCALAVRRGGLAVANVYFPNQEPAYDVGFVVGLRNCLGAFWFDENMSTEVERDFVSVGGHRDEIKSRADELQRVVVVGGQEANNVIELSTGPIIAKSRAYLSANNFAQRNTE